MLVPIRGPQFPPQPTTPSAEAEIFLNQDLFSRADYLERQGRLEAAGALFQHLAESSGGETSEPLRASAQRRFEALTGSGGLSAERIAFLANHFVDQLMDPVLLGAMTGAGATFQLSRMGWLGLASRMGLRSSAVMPAAGLLAFAVEATAFPALIRGGNHLLGRAVDGSAQAWGHDVAGSFLVLGGLKLFGLLGRQALRGLGTAGTHSLLRRVVPQAAMYLGILSGHKSEQWFGLRPEQGGVQTALESLVTLAHFNGAGRLIGHLPVPRLTEGASGPAGSLRRGLRELRLQPDTLGVVRGAVSRGEGSSTDEARASIFFMEGGAGDGFTSEEGGYSPEMSRAIRERSARYLGDLLQNKGPIIWFLPAREGVELGLLTEQETDLVLADISFKKGIYDQVVFNFVDATPKESGLILRVPYVFDVSEVVSKGFLLEDSPGQYRVNPRIRYFRKIWDTHLARDPDGPSPEEIIRQRTRTFLTGDGRNGDPSTPPPPPPPVVTSQHFPDIPVSVAGRVSAHPMFKNQEPFPILSMQMGPVRAGGESMVWIQIPGGAGPEMVAGEGFTQARFVFLSVVDAQNLGLLEFNGEDFQLRSHIRSLYIRLQPQAVEPDREEIRAVAPAYLDETVSALIRSQGFPAIRETSMDSARERVYLMTPELAEATGAGEFFHKDFQWEVLSDEAGQDPRVRIRFVGNRNYQEGQAIHFQTLTMRAEDAIRLRLMGRTASGAWRQHPEPWPIRLVSEYRLDFPVEIEVGAAPASAPDLTGRIEVVPHSEEIDAEQMVGGVRIPIASFDLRRIEWNGRNEVICTFYQPNNLERSSSLPFQGRGFSLRVQDALDLFLIQPTFGRGFELNPHLSEVWIFPSASGR